MSASTSATASPLRLRLLLLAASGLVPMILLLAWGINHLIEERRAQAEVSALEFSRAIASAVDAELRSVIGLLQQMSTSDELEKADLHSFHLSARRSAEYLQWRNVILNDSTGRVLFRATQPLDAPALSTVDPESLNEVLRTKEPVISRVVDAPSDGTNTFSVRVPVMRGGNLVYVITAVLPTERIAGVLSRQNLPAVSVATVVDPTGRVILRSPAAGIVFVTPSLKALLDRGGAEGSGIITTAEGVRSYAGYTRLRESGWAVAVAFSVAEANKGFDALLRAIAIGLAASLGLSALLAWILSRKVIGPIEQLKHAAAALGRGNPVHVPPLQIDELDEVAEALMNAAAERDRANIERECANEERNRSIEERERAAAERERLAGQISEALRMAEDANRTKDQFLAMLGHELRNPLAPISNAVQLMALKGDESTAQERGVIERQLVHVTRLVDDLLDVSRITSGRLALKRETISIAQVLMQVVDTIRPSLFQRALTLDIAPQARAAWVSGDEVRLVQVFNNMLVNAIKFTSPGGSITVRAAVDATEVRVDVVDDGVGMTDTDLAHVFELFYQAPQSADRALGGLGLGLPIVKSVVEMHGGRVQATSEGISLGSCITVWLPLCEAPVPHADLAAPPPAQGAGRVMVVDDNEDAADTCATLLELSGYQTRVAYTPEGALQVLHEFTPDIGILDIGLPGMSGYELARQLKRGGYAGRLVALTGYGQAADMAASKAAGFDAHLTKPVSAHELLDLIAKLVPSGSAASLRA
jgi:signal transduction histidine kinase/ActR/RegA family two-component response regulator